MSKPPSQNAIGRALGLSSAAMVKLKKQGCPMDSVEAAQAWRQARQNVAARKPLPVSEPVAAVASAADQVGGGTDAPATDGRSAPGAQKPAPAGFFPRDLPPSDMAPWPDDFGRVGGDDFREMIRANEVGGGDPAEDHQAARTRREIAEANLAEMREAEERGDLIRVAAVKSALAAAFSTTREALLQLPARLAPLIAADSDPASVQNTLHAEIHHALQDLSGASARLGQDHGVLA